MVGRITARNTSQKIGTSQLLIRRTLSPFTFYTCPAGKRAIIKGVASCDQTGSAAQVRLKVNNIIILEWRSTGGDPNKPQELRVGDGGNLDVEVEENQSLIYDQNAGTNATMDINAKIQETPL